MTSPFAAAAAMSSAAVDVVYGEDFYFRPMTHPAGDVNARRVPDPERPAPTDPITAAYTDNFARAFSGPARQQGVKPEKPGHASLRPQISIDAAALPYPVRIGDLFVRASDGMKFAVAEPRPSAGRLFFDVNELGNKS